jgi:hypothetical protein
MNAEDEVLKLREKARDDSRQGEDLNEISQLEAQLKS